MTYKSTILADSPTSLWMLDETSGTAAADSAGSDTGTYSGSFTLNQSTGLSGVPTCADLSSTGLIVASAVLTGNASCSLEFWFKCSAVTTTGQWLVANGDGSHGYGFQVSGNSSTNGHLWVVFNGVRWIDTGFLLINNQWYHVVLVLDAGGKPTVYVNGNSVYSDSGTNAIAPNASSVFWGSNLHGAMAATAVYPSALTAAQVFAHYKTGFSPTSPILDGHASGTFGAVTNPSVTVTTVAANDILVLCVGSNGNAGGSPQNVVVNSVSGGGLTWTKRAEIVNPDPQTDRNGSLSVWWALAAAAGSYTATATLNEAPGNGKIGLFGVNGCYTASPWDGNGTLPGTKHNGTLQSTISTFNPDDMLLAFLFELSSGDNTTAGTPTGFSNILTNGNDLSAACKSVSALQSSQTITWTQPNGAGNTQWFVADALTADAPGAAAGAPILLALV